MSKQRSRALLLATLIFVIAARPLSAAQPRVDAIQLKGPINSVAANYVSRTLSEAAANKAEAVVLELDTPGGYDTAMRDIVQAITASPVPVVVYVSPSGARAASAGTFITLAGHVAAMAPNTAIGAAHPVDSTGGDIQGTMAEKVTNDAAAFIRSIANAHGRNADWAERAVRESISASNDEALQAGVVDLVAPDVPSLLQELNGRTVFTVSGEHTLQTNDAHVVRVSMNLVEDFLSLLNDPTIAYILLILGMLGIFFELASPGAIVPGVIGGISILLALYSLGTLPVNWTGALLILLAFVLFVLEVKVTSHGLLTLAGITAMTLGSLMLVNRASAPFLEISKPVIATVVLLTAGFFTFVVAAVIRARRHRVVTGREGMIGRIGLARTPLTPSGLVFVEGETWDALASDKHIEAGERVVVTKIKGLTLTVTRVSS